jgi:hypothetical protein
VLGTDAPGGLHPVAARHAKIHEHHVRVVVLHQCNGLFAVAARADDLHAFEEAQDGDQPFAHNGLVVDHHHPERPFLIVGHAGTRTSTRQPLPEGPD